MSLEGGSILKAHKNERSPMSLLTTHKLPVIAQIEDGDLIWTVERNCERTVLLVSTDKNTGERYNKFGPMNLSEAFKRFALCQLDEFEYLPTTTIPEMRKSIEGISAVVPLNSITVSIHAVNQ